MRLPGHRMERRWQAMVRADTSGILRRREKELVRLRAEMAQLHHQVALAAVARVAETAPTPTAWEQRVRDNVVTFGARNLRGDGRRRTGRSVPWVRVSA